MMTLYDEEKIIRTREKCVCQEEREKGIQIEYGIEEKS